jgi:hypothetical protein
VEHSEVPEPSRLPLGCLVSSNGCIAAVQINPQLQDSRRDLEWPVVDGSKRPHTPGRRPSLRRILLVTDWMHRRRHWLYRTAPQDACRGLGPIIVWFMRRSGPQETTALQEGGKSGRRARARNRRPSLAESERLSEGAQCARSGSLSRASGAGSQVPGRVLAANQAPDTPLARSGVAQLSRPFSPSAAQASFACECVRLGIPLSPEPGTSWRSGTPGEGWRSPSAAA